MQEQSKPSWFSRNWKWFVPVLALMPVVICGGFITLIVTLVFGMIKSSAPYTESLAAVRADPQVQAALGTPIEPAFLVTGEMNVSGTGGEVDIAYDVSGPSGEARVYVVGTRLGGNWTYDVLAVEIDATGERLNIPPP